MTLRSGDVTVDGVRLHYLEAGAGPPVLLLHGWPTSSHLWRGVMPAIAANNRVIAPDLAGFGASDKPIDASYSFRFHARMLDGLLAALGVDTLGLAVHDLGGPVGLHWAVHRRERITRLALLNTVVYPELSWAVLAFVAAARMPGLRGAITSRWGLRRAMQFGTVRTLDHDELDAYAAPFATADARRALAKAGYGLDPRGFTDIANGLRAFDVPVRVLYGERDSILPDVAKTMRRVAADLPQAVVTSLPDASHFLQEDRPDEVGRVLAEFFAG